MKKWQRRIPTLLGATLFLLFPLLGSFVRPAIAYTDDEPLRLNLSQPALKIAQFTDLHLTYGFDAYDQKTLRMIATLTREEHPDLVVLSGDLTMSPLSPWLYRLLSDHMNALGVPWTFILGNHDSDFWSHGNNLQQLALSQALLFKTGPELDDGGIGNFKIETRWQNQPFFNVYLLDSKAERGGLTSYDWVSETQVGWYAEHVESDQITQTSSIVFMHIPLPEYQAYAATTLIDGAMLEGGVYCQGQNTGFFQTMVLYGMSKGIFVGHDHLNNFSFMKDDILLAYGQTSGYNGYGSNPRGARFIEIDALGNLSSRLVEYQGN